MRISDWSSDVCSSDVLTDAELWKNDHIDQYDNAWLLWYLSADTQVTLLYNIDHDNLLALLIRYFPQALVALLALIALWLKYQSSQRAIDRRSTRLNSSH